MGVALPAAKLAAGYRSTSTSEKGKLYLFSTGEISSHVVGMCFERVTETEGEGGDGGKAELNFMLSGYWTGLGAGYQKEYAYVEDFEVGDLDGWKEEGGERVVKVTVQGEDDDVCVFVPVVVVEDGRDGQDGGTEQVKKSMVERLAGIAVGVENLKRAS